MREWWQNVWGAPRGKRRDIGGPHPSRYLADQIARLGHNPASGDRLLYRIHVKLKEGRA